MQKLVDFFIWNIGMTSNLDWEFQRILVCKVCNANAVCRNSHVFFCWNPELISFLSMQNATQKCCWMKLFVLRLIRHLRIMIPLKFNSIHSDWLQSEREWMDWIIWCCCFLSVWLNHKFLSFLVYAFSVHTYRRFPTE